MTTRTGKCLCGAVRFTANDMDSNFSACHCAMCRRWTSGPFLAAKAKLTDLRGEADIAAFRSSDWAERCFCARCGTSLFYRVTAPGAHAGDVHLSVGALDDMGGMTLASELFVDEKPAGYAFAGATKKMTGAEAFAMFAPSGEG